MPNREERRRLEKKGRLEKGDLIRITREISNKATNDAFRPFMLTYDSGYGENNAA